jgi:hypothetical protein
MKEEYKDKEYDSLFEAISAKDNEAIERFNKASREGMIVRIT